MSFDPTYPIQTEREREEAEIARLRAEVKLLLDRLQRAEAVVEVVKRVTGHHKRNCSCTICKAIDAWEEEKARPQRRCF